MSGYCRVIFLKEKFQIFSFRIYRLKLVSLYIQNQIKTAQPVKLTITEKGQPLAYAEVNLREKGATDKQAQQFKAEATVKSNLRFQKLEST